MRKTFYFFFFYLIVVELVSSCAKERMSPINPEGDLVLVNLSLNGEIDVEKSPLTKAFTSNDLIGIQVYQGSSDYAYGLFDDVSKMSIYLHTGKTYKFVCTVVKDGKSLVYSWNSNTTSDDKLPIGSSGTTVKIVRKKGQYSIPFINNISGTYVNTEYSEAYLSTYDYSGTEIGNAFQYSSTEHFVCLQYGRIETSRKTYTNYPHTDRFYGEVSGYKPSSNDFLSIPLKRVGFGLTLSVSGITDGEVDVTIKNSDRTFANETGITQDTVFGVSMWSFFDLASAYQYADNYAENFTVGVIWKRGVGVTQDLGSKVVQFKRNTVNLVKINLSTSTKSSGLSVTLEEPEINTEQVLVGN